MSEESIDVESDRNDLCNHLNNFDSTYMKGDILAFARILDKKYAEKKEFIRRLQFNAHVGLPADEIAMALFPEDLPLQ